jgi:hypothetical protein
VRTPTSQSSWTDLFMSAFDTGGSSYGLNASNQMTNGGYDPGNPAPSAVSGYPQQQVGMATTGECADISRKTVRSRKDASKGNLHVWVQSFGV